MQNLQQPQISSATKIDHKPLRPEDEKKEIEETQKRVEETQKQQANKDAKEEKAEEQKSSKTVRTEFEIEIFLHA